MYYVDKKQFKDTYAIVSNKKTLHPAFKKLKNYVQETYDISVFNITLKKIDKRKTVKKSVYAGYTHRLIFQVGSYEERVTMQLKEKVIMEGVKEAFTLVNDPQKQQDILDKYFLFAREQKMNIDINSTDIWVDYHFSFSIDYLGFIVSKIEKKISGFVQSLYKDKANIWQIITSGVGVHVFYYFTKEVQSNEKSGINEKIRQMYLLAIEEHDFLALYKREFINFDSKENLDNNYEGNLFYYLK